MILRKLSVVPVQEADGSWGRGGGKRKGFYSSVCVCVLIVLIISQMVLDMQQERTITVSQSLPHPKNLKSLIAFFPKMEELFHLPEAFIFLCYALLCKPFNLVKYSHINKQGRKREDENSSGSSNFESHLTNTAVHSFDYGSEHCDLTFFLPLCEM